MRLSDLLKVTDIANQGDFIFQVIFFRGKKKEDLGLDKTS